MWGGLSKVTRQVGDVRPHFHICLAQAQRSLCSGRQKRLSSREAELMAA